MKHPDLVTVLMPCKDAHPVYFELALNSVLEQSVPHWRLMIIDDHSTNEATLKILKNLANSDDRRIQVIKNQTRFITGALNTAMALVETPFVCSLHCDDLLDENAVKILNDCISEFPEVDYFHSGRVHINDDGEKISKFYQPKETFTLEDFKRKGPVKHLHCWRVKLALEIGGMDEELGLHGADDYDFVWCMAEAGCRFQAINECLYYYRDHRTHYRLTTHVTREKQVNELRKIFLKHGMTETEIDEELNKRVNDYLQQALYENENDQLKKEEENFDPNNGWRFEYPAGS